MGKRRDSSLKPTPFRGQFSHQRGSVSLRPPQVPPSAAWCPPPPTVKVQFLLGPSFRIALLTFLPVPGPAFLEGPVAWSLGPWLSFVQQMSLNGTRLWEMLQDLFRPARCCGGMVPCSHRTQDFKRAESRGSRVGGWRVGRAGAVSVLGLVRRAQWVKGYFKAGTQRAHSLSLRESRQRTT